MWEGMSSYQRNDVLCGKMTKAGELYGLGDHSLEDMFDAVAVPRACSDPRDRIYSLVTVGREDESEIER